MNNDQELDIVQAMKTILKKKNVLLIIMAASLVMGAIYTFIINRPKYQSSTKILIDKNAPSIVEFVSSNDIVNEVAIGLNKSIGYVQGATKVTFDAKTMLVTITGSSKNNKEAYNIVVKYSEVLKTRLENTYGVNTYTAIEQPQIATSAYNITHTKDLIMFMVAGIVVCGVYGIFLITFSGSNIFSAIENSKITF